MKKEKYNILIIGKLNEVTKSISDYLEKSPDFNLQFCEPKIEAVIKMFKVFRADIALISLIGAADVDKKIFDEIKFHHKLMPAITIGTEFESNSFIKYFDNDQFINLIRPIDNKSVYEAICKRLGIKTHEITFAKPEQQKPIEAQTQKLKVLVVDDDGQMLRTLKMILGIRYEVFFANSGLKAMVSIGKHQPDVIILDYDMPVCSGKQVFEMIKADPDFRRIPVIFLTGFGDEVHIRGVLKLRPAGYLLKPTTEAKLVQAIEHAVR